MCPLQSESYLRAGNGDYGSRRTSVIFSSPQNRRQNTGIYQISFAPSVGKTIRIFTSYRRHSNTDLSPLPHRGDSVYFSSNPPHGQSRMHRRQNPMRKPMICQLYVSFSRKKSLPVLKLENNVCSTQLFCTNAATPYENPTVRDITDTPVYVPSCVCVCVCAWRDDVLPKSPFFQRFGRSVVFSEGVLRTL